MTTTSPTTFTQSTGNVIRAVSARELIGPAVAGQFVVAVAAIEAVVPAAADARYS